VGIPGEVIFNFDFASNRYLINGWSPFNYVEPQKLEVNETFLTNFNEDDMPF
jgi:hypothetical protein